MRLRSSPSWETVAEVCTQHSQCQGVAMTAEHFRPTLHGWKIIAIQTSFEIKDSGIIEFREILPFSGLGTQER